MKVKTAVLPRDCKLPQLNVTVLIKPISFKFGSRFWNIEGENKHKVLLVL